MPTRARVNVKTVSTGPRADPVRFATYIQAQALEIVKARSGERTKLRLMGVGISLLENTGFRELNIEDVAKGADAAKGTFYIHFKSKDAFLLDLCRRFVDFEQVTLPASRRGETVFARIRNFVAWYERSFALHVGVMRCLIQMGEVSPEMRDLWHERNRMMTDRVITDWWEGKVPTKADPDLARLTLRIVGGMLDQSLFDRHQIQVGPGRQAPEDPALFVELHTLLTFRALFGADPPADELRISGALLDWPDGG